MLCSYLNLAPVLQNLSVGCDSHFKSKHVGIFNKCIIKLNSLFIRIFISYIFLKFEIIGNKLGVETKINLKTLHQSRVG